jgi:DNA replication protein DnaC
MNGMTIHTWAGIGIKDRLSDDDLKRMKERKYLKEHLENAQVLIIDEISMLHAKQLNLVNQVLNTLKKVMKLLVEFKSLLRVIFPVTTSR